MSAENRTLAPAASASLDDWLTYLENLHSKAIDLGLARVTAVAEKLGVATPKAKVITVAGTNGKGSTVRYLEVILNQAGYRTGVYVSPHLHHYAERVRLNQGLLDDAAHCQAFAAVEAARDGISLSYFEFGTLAALWLFAQQQPDVIILEVGLGGRLDAVNCVAADVAAVTSIGLDHCDWLGDTRELIGYEKAGVFRKGKPAIVGDPDMPASIGAHAQEIGATLYRVGHEFHYTRTAPAWNFQCGALQLKDLPLPQLPLPNAATALAILHQLPLAVPRAAIYAGLAEARLAGRLEYRDGNPATLLDVAHNPHAAAYLYDTIQNGGIPGGIPQRVVAVVGMLKDKDIRNTLAALSPLVDEWHFATLHEPRGATAAQLQDALAALEAPLSQSVHQHQEVSEAYTAALNSAAQSKPQGLVLVFGSFYTVNKVAPGVS